MSDATPAPATEALLQTLERLVAADNCGPFPWKLSEEPGEITAEGYLSGGAHYPIGKFWGGALEWVDRPELVLALVNNLPEVMAALARSSREAELTAGLRSLVDDDCTYDGPNIVIRCASHSDAMARMRRARSLLTQRGQP